MIGILFHGSLTIMAPKARAIRIKIGDEAVVRGDYFGVFEPKKSTGIIGLAIAQYDGGKVLAVVPASSVKHLIEATREIVLSQRQPFYASARPPTSFQDRNP